MRPLVAFVEHGELVIDGDAVPEGEHPYARRWRSCTAYYPTGTDQSVLEGYMRDGDHAYRGRLGGSISVAYKSARSCLRLCPAATWGIKTDDPEVLGRELTNLEDEVEAEGMEWGRTVATLAGRILREKAPKMAQLRPRFRRLAHEAIHQGPMVATRGGAAHATALDRKQAFLHALRAPMPIPGTWVGARGPSWSVLENLSGFVRATVVIPPHLYVGRLPPLPVRRRGVTIYPVGVVRGVWTIELLRDAIDHGSCELHTVHEAAICRTAPIHARAADRIAAIDGKGLRKRLYTRYWGRMASLGGWEGVLELPDGKINPEDEAGWRRWRGSKLWWTWNGRGGTDHRCPPDYRPDHSAFVASHNHLAVNQLARQIGQDALVGAHVDCLWIAGPTPSVPDGWAIKGAGPLRFYGTGTYAHAGKLAAQGVPGVLTPERLREHGAQMQTGGGLVRNWRNGSSPTTDPMAESDPVFHAPADVAPLPEPSIYTGCWTKNGWFKAEKLPGEEEAAP